jgi:hypothetical protein
MKCGKLFVGVKPEVVVVYLNGLNRREDLEDDQKKNGRFPSSRNADTIADGHGNTSSSMGSQNDGG